MLNHLMKCNSELSPTRNYKPIKQIVPHKTKHSYKVWSNLRKYLEPKIEAQQSRRHRSSVWKYYSLKDNLGTVECTNCKKELKSAFNVSNLRRHYLSCFNRLEKEKGSPNSRSFVWDHFVKCWDDPNQVTCRHCDKTYRTNSGTSNLKDHMLRFHRNIMIDMGLVKESECAGSLENDPTSEDTVNISLPMFRRPSIRKNNSFVWQHYQKTKIKHVAICNYCSKIIKTGGSTSNLRYHLMKYHKQYIAASSDSNICKSGQNDHETVLECKSENLIHEDDHEVKIENNVLHATSNEMVDFSTLLEGITYDGNSIIVDSEYQEQKISEDGCKDVQKDKLLKTNKRSFVWRHFSSTGTAGKAICNYCSRICNNTGGNTSALRMHLIKLHADQLREEKESFTTAFITYDSNSIILDSEDQKQKVSKDGCKDVQEDQLLKTNKRSFVWRHFSSTDTPGKAICNYCSRVCNNTGGNTSSLRMHLIKLHGDQLQDEKEVSTASFSAYRRHLKTRSLVWEHFVKNNHSKEITCLCCGSKFVYCGNTSNLRDHLIRKHPNEYKTMVAKENNQKATSEMSLAVGSIWHKTNQSVDDGEIEPTQKHPKSFVWQHFQKTDASQKAICNYCKKEINTFGNTSILGNHLWRYHKREISACKENTFLDESSGLMLTRNENITDIDKLEEENESVDADESSVQEFKLTPRGKPVGLIWKHFLKEDGSALTTCVYCNKKFRWSTTSNLWRHLVRFHYDMVKQDVKKKVDRSTSKSMVWNHFRKDTISHKASCFYCKKTFKTFGTTSNLWKHLTTVHSEVMDLIDSKIDERCDSDDAEGTQEVEAVYLVEETPSTGKIKSKSAIWEHFRKEGNSTTAVCMHCKCRYSCKSTSLLWRHLLRKHGENTKIPEEEIVAEDIPIDEAHGEETLTEDGSVVWNDFVEINSEKASCKYNVNTTSQHEEEINGTEEENPLKELGDIENVLRNHFGRNEEGDRAVCVYCREEFSDDVQKLLSHLLNEHEELVRLDIKSLLEKNNTEANILLVDDKSNVIKTLSAQTHLETDNDLIVVPAANDNYSEEKEEDPLETPITHSERFGKNRSSYVWKYFVRSADKRKAACVYCSKTYSSGSTTSNLWRHLFMCHKEHFDNAKRFRWLHREKPSDINIYCNKECRTFEKTNLSLHLTEYHKVAVNSSEAGEVLELSDLYGENVHTTSVWGCFEKIVAPQFAVCGYCQLWCEIDEDSDNLKNHLMECHRDDIERGTIDQTVKQRQRKLSERSCNDDPSPKSTTLSNEDDRTDLRKNFTSSTIPNFVTCNQCGKLFNKSPSVMAGHLEMHQESEKGRISHTNIDLGTNEPAAEKTISPSGRECKSFVWNHFKSTKDRYVVTCIHCGKKLKSCGNTTNLQNHLLCRHRDFLSDKDLRRLTTNETRKRKNHQDAKQIKKFSSFVWRHFRKSNIPQCAICNHCRKLCKTCGNTTNLWKHLVRYHRSIFDDEEVPVETMECDVKDFVKLEPLDVEEECQPDYISEDDLKKAAASADVNGLEDYVILVVA